MPTPATPLALAFGDPGPLPFLGHFRAEARGPGSLLRVAGRLGSAGDAVEASALAGAVEAAVRRLTRVIERPDDRVALVRGWWDAVTAICADTPAAMQADFAALVVAGDQRGVTVSGVGLAGCWFVAGGQPPRPMVPAGHPLLGPLGPPSSRPGGMTLNRLPEVVVAELRHPVVAATGLRVGDLFAAAGARR